MTTITKKTPKTLKSIKPARGEFRYQGLSWVKDGIAVAATDGRWLTARATSLEEAATLIESAENPNEQLPPGAARLLRNADSNDIRGTRKVDAMTLPEEAIAQRARERRATKVQSAEALLVDAKARLEETLAKPRHLRYNGGTKTELERHRKDVAEAKEVLRRARTYYEAGENSISCGGVIFDLNLIREALRSLGERDATLDVSGIYDPGVIRTTTGIAILMPLKPELS